MGEQDRGAVVRGGVGDDAADRQPDAARIPFVVRHVNAARLCVEMRDPEMLDRPILLCEASREEITRRRRSVELQREFGTLVPHADRLTEGGQLLDANRVRSES